MWPNYWYSPYKILSAYLKGKDKIIEWPYFKNRRLIHTHFSRVSIFLACKHLNLSSGDEVLAPSYNCGSEIDPLLFCGAKVVLYRVKEDTNIDIEDILSRISSSTKAIYVIHYFGWPQELTELVKICKERGILLIEDCALSLFSKDDHGPIGCAGDAAIHCFWKTLPVPDGGALSLPDETLKAVEKLKAPRLSSVVQTTSPFIKSWLRGRGRKYLGHFYKDLRNVYRRLRGTETSMSKKEKESQFPQLIPECYFDERIKDRGISRLSKGLMISAEPERIINLRRKNYKQLYEAIYDLPGVQPLYSDLPVGVCPLVMPVLVKDRNKWLNSLDMFNVFPYKWWMYYHPAFSWDEFPEAIKLKNHLLAFHINQYMDEDDIKHVANSIKKVSYNVK